MFEDFRKLANEEVFIDVEKEQGLASKNPVLRDNYSGMTPRQRFTVAILVLMMTAVIGVLFLLVSAKIVPPFLG